MVKSAFWITAIAAVTATMAMVVSAAWQGSPQTKPKERTKLVMDQSPKREDKVVLTDEEWKKKLTKEQYDILRSHGTEPPFCVKFDAAKGKGDYQCVGCDLPLFSNDHKFESGTGWPSFYQPVSKDAVWVRRDVSYGMVRQEVLCSRCDGHLGHVFDDAPSTPTGLRYCINGRILKFVPTKD